jgi:signal peptidase I
MKIKKKVFLVVFVILGLGIILLFKVFQIFGAYEIPTITMEPTIPFKSKVFVLKKWNYEYNDIVMLKVKPLPFENADEDYSIISRIIGKEFDTIKMIGGKLYRNNEFIDDTLSLLYFFKIYKDSIDYLILKNNEIFISPNKESGYITFNTDYKNLLKYKLKYYSTRILSDKRIYEDVFENSDNWTLENFGPVIVPESNFFLISDNRSLALDSRMRGFIKKDRIIGKVIRVFKPKKSEIKLNYKPQQY